MNKKIGLIYPFFGRLPWYFSYFIHSCKYNPAIHFIVITDNDCVFRLPPNVVFIKKTLAEVKQIADQALDCDVAVEPQPFKFCDMRPAFGLIFHHWLKDFDFWGHGDTDVIFGDIQDFLTENEMLESYDIISLRHDYLSSWFTLYRNCEKINTLFTQSKDYKKVFTTPKYFNFDETNFTFREFSSELPYDQIASEIESMTHLVKKLQQANEIRAYFDLHAIEGATGKTKWQHGKLIYRNRYEVLLYHLLELKKVYRPKRAPAQIPELFYISPTRIYF